MWVCRCDCGNEIIVSSSSLVSGNTKSCGCVGIIKLKQMATKHGQYNTKLYKVWSSMKHRCLNSKDKYYYNYGGRGIKVCAEWLTFENFFKWAMGNGYRSGLTLERSNNNGNYEPQNCIWIPKAEQSGNTRRCRFRTFHGKTMNIKQWSIELGISYSLIQSRLKHGWSADKALSEPVLPKGHFHCKMIEFKGESKTISEWSRLLGINYKTLHGHLRQGKSIEQIINLAS